MGRIYFDGTADPVAQDEAAVREGVAQAYAAVAVAQQEARTFFTSYGPAVSAGHADINAAGRQGDPDTSGPDASDG
ncbi:MAG TPA: hypothetical protein VGJ59_22195 [Jatrophihabitantaceae bacterium]